MLVHGLLHLQKSYKNRACFRMISAECVEERSPKPLQEQPTAAWVVGQRGLSTEKEHSLEVNGEQQILAMPGCRDIFTIHQGFCILENGARQSFSGTAVELELMSRPGPHLHTLSWCCRQILFRCYSKDCYSFFLCVLG